MTACHRCGCPLDPEWVAWAKANGVRRDDPACAECALEGVFTPDRKKIASDSGEVDAMRDFLLNVRRGPRV